MVKYDWKITLKKGVISALIFGLPQLVEAVLRGNPSWASLTVGSLLVMSANVAKHKLKLLK